MLKFRQIQKYKNLMQHICLFLMTFFINWITYALTYGIFLQLLIFFNIILSAKTARKLKKMKQTAFICTKTVKFPNSFSKNKNFLKCIHFSWQYLKLTSSKIRKHTVKIIFLKTFSIFPLTSVFFATTTINTTFNTVSSVNHQNTTYTTY